MSHHDTFAKRLIAAEHVDAKRKERYEMEMQKILSQTLTPAKRIAYAFGAVFGLAVGVNWVVLMVTVDMTGEYETWGRAVFGILGVLGLVWAALAGRIAVRGRVDLRKDRRAVARLVWGLSLLIFITALFVSGLELRYGSGRWSVFILVVGLAHLLIGALFVSRSLVEQSELSIRAKLLEIELELTELNEKLGRSLG